MPLDFAYRIHSDIGNKTVGAIVNGKIVPLSYKLKTGDVVEIKTNKACTGPTSEWLKLAKTSHAKTKIKAFINKKQRDAFVAKGLEELTVIGKTIIMLQLLWMTSKLWIYSVKWYKNSRRFVLDNR